MTTDNKENEDKILFPINQGEQAKQATRDSLLARDVFKKIADLLKISVSKLKDKDCVELDDHRAHEAILIDGSRGTGKSSVLVNLSLYMDDEPELSNKLLILKPVDPTLLENGDDLFLNIIVAALIRNIDIKKSLNKGDKKAEAFYEQLQKLGSALEGVQTQKTQYGLDKLRAFIGNHGIAEEVHALFHNALQLTEKKLIVLPIDDVDTSLQHAFENMEVVRKYLATPYVVPIISGDLDLYHDVTWRDFFGRIIKDGRIDESDAKDRAQNLANEYQRKVLPLPRRIEVPSIDDYFKNDQIWLTKDNAKDKLLQLPVFKNWLDALLNERVNGVENSYLTLPIKSIREFSQLLVDTKDLISSLEITNINLDEIRKKIFLNNSPSISHTIIEDWYVALKKHFLGHESGARVYLTMDANIYWQRLTNKKNIFDVDLFNPLSHSQKRYAQFRLVEGISESWGSHLEVWLPERKWRDSLPKECLLPYPLPEKGTPSAKCGKPVIKLDLIANAQQVSKDQPSHVETAEFIRQLVCHSSFYSRSNEGNLVLTGRIFELLILSLIRDVDAEEISHLLSRPPFYSAAAVANTKTFEIDDDEDADNGIEIDIPDTPIDNAKTFLSGEITKWRSKNNLSSTFKPHAWLVYNVMNKYFNQVSVENSWISDAKGYSKHPELRYTADVAMRSFNSICAIFGSFEKSSLFDLNEKIAYRNGSNANKDFEKNQLFKQNIEPFLKVINEDDVTSEKTPNILEFSLTRHLYSHPLKNLLKIVLDNTSPPIITESNSKKSLLDLENAESLANKIFKKTFNKLPTKQEISTGIKNQDPLIANVLTEFKKQSKLTLTKIAEYLKDNSVKKRFSNLRRMLEINSSNGS
ncbi:antiviral RADAR system adenosine triphosphatase RdrA [Undibacterium sp.]|uniref:antiviral RADAR system adenosine triphosphatase RdrA n=1 Tax=Undibacterium sp. TaxID=1914977 RepID=UPI0025DEAE08|nr:antiviral RADAR system adenosine triphosphatase RdrA [Undibacterium sp.]